MPMERKLGAADQVGQIKASGLGIERDESYLLHTLLVEETRVVHFVGFCTHRQAVLS